MKPTLNIVTPVTRPENLKEIAMSVQTDLFNIEWYLVYDRVEPFKFYHGDTSIFTVIHHSTGDDIAGNVQRNKALDFIHDGFVYFLDDDNIIHPDFYETLWFEIDSDFDKLAFLFEAVKKNGNPFCSLDDNFMNIMPDEIDTCQFVVSRDLIGSAQWPNLQNSAGFFIYEIFNKYPEKFQNTSGLVYHNYLR